MITDDQLLAIARGESGSQSSTELIRHVADELIQALAANMRLHAMIAKLRAGECLGMVYPTDLPCERDNYCSKACQDRDGDGSRGLREKGITY